MSECERVVFEFIGGPRDGERLSGCLEAGMLTEAGAFYRHTNGAEVGKRFWCPTEYSLTALSYYFLGLLGGPGSGRLPLSGPPLRDFRPLGERSDVARPHSARGRLGIDVRRKPK